MFISKLVRFSREAVWVPSVLRKDPLRELGVCNSVEKKSTRAALEKPGQLLCELCTS